MKLTKIVATISDKHCEPEFIAALHHAGMNVVRMNSAHLDRTGIERIVNSVRSVSPLIATMIDTKGPEIRTTATASGDPIRFDAGDTVVLRGETDKPTDHSCINVNYANIISDLHPGDHLLIDDGTLDFEIVAIDGDEAQMRATNSGTLGSRKSVNVPGVAIDLPSVSDRDKANIAIAAELGVDFVAHSFVRSADDVRHVQAAIDACGGEMKIISKIENSQGVDNFDEILDACYGIMVARGDLGIEVPAERVPAIQRMMVRKCIAAHKPVIVATQMLHSMIENPRPTRAEVSDVAESVYQHADALMLSGETAAGLYPVKAVETMSRIAKEVEHTLEETPVDAPPLVDATVTSFLARQAVQSELRVGTRAIVTDAFHGRTARYVASFRGLRPVLAICHTSHLARSLSLSYGIMPYYVENYRPTRLYPTGALAEFVKCGLVKPDDRIAYLGSTDGLEATSLEINSVKALLAESEAERAL